MPTPQRFNVRAVTPRTDMAVGRRPRPLDRNPCRRLRLRDESKRACALFVAVEGGGQCGIPRKGAKSALVELLLGQNAGEHGAHVHRSFRVSDDDTDTIQAHCLGMGGNSAAALPGGDPRQRFLPITLFLVLENAGLLATRSQQVADPRGVVLLLARSLPLRQACEWWPPAPQGEREIGGSSRQRWPHRDTVCAASPGVGSGPPSPLATTAAKYASEPPEDRRGHVPPRFGGIHSSLILPASFAAGQTRYWHTLRRALGPRGSRHGHAEASPRAIAARTSYSVSTRPAP